MISKLVLVLLTVTVVCSRSLTREGNDATDRKVVCKVAEQEDSAADLPLGVLCIRITDSEAVDSGKHDYLCRQPNHRLLKILKARMGENRSDLHEQPDTGKEEDSEEQETKEKHKPILCRAESSDEVDDMPRGLACIRSRNAEASSENAYVCHSLQHPRGGRPGRRPKLDLEDELNSRELRSGKEDMTTPASRQGPNGNNNHDRPRPDGDNNRGDHPRPDGNRNRGDKSKSGRRNGDNKSSQGEKSESKRTLDDTLDENTKHQRPKGERLAGQEPDSESSQKGQDKKRPMGRRPKGNHPTGQPPTIESSEGDKQDKKRPQDGEPKQKRPQKSEEETKREDKSEERNPDGVISKPRRPAGDKAGHRHPHGGRSENQTRPDEGQNRKRPQGNPHHGGRSSNRQNEDSADEINDLFF